GLLGQDATGTYQGEGRLFVFRLDGARDFEPVRGQPSPAATPRPYTTDPQQLAPGQHIHGLRRSVCHRRAGVSGGALADLRHASEATFAIFHDIVRGGAYSGLGMPDFGPFVSEEEAEAVKQWLLSLRAQLPGGALQ